MKAANTPVTVNGWTIHPDPCIICQQPIDSAPVRYRMGRWFCSEHMRKAEWFPTPESLSGWIEQQKGLINAKD